MEQVIEGYRLSPQQQRVWALLGASEGRGHPAWLALGVRGPVDAGRLRAALEAAVARSEVLRTHFVAGAEPLQVVGEAAVAWSEAQWPALDDAAVAARVARLARAALAEGGAPAAGGPGVHATLARVSATEHVLWVRASALAADAAAMARLGEEVAGAYAGGVGEPADEMQYADFAEWQNDLLGADDTAAARAAWKRMDPLPLASARLPWEARAAEAGAATAFAAGQIEGAAAVDGAAAALGVPAEAVLLAAWAALLARLTRTPDVVVGTRFAGRDYEETRHAMGPFARHLPLALRAEGGASFAALATAARKAMDDAAERQDAFSWDLFSGAGAGSEPPVLAFGFDAAALPEPRDAGGVRFLPMDAWAAADRFRVLLSVQRGPGGATARVFHDPAVLAPGDAARLARMYATLLGAAAAAPETPLDALPLADALERQRLFVDLQPATPPPAAAPVAAAFLRQAARTPRAPALRHEGEALDYAALAERSGRLAAHLRALGAGAEARVGILLDRSADAVVALLAVLRSGAAYVPIDPSYPPERIRWMIEDAGVALLVSTAARAALAQGTGATVVRLDDDAAEIAARTPDAAPTPVHPASAAYVVYTSGSTGTPKGVVVPHGALAAYARDAAGVLRAPAGASYAVLSTLAADLGNTMVFPALVSGGVLHVVSEARATDPEAWTEYAERHGIDCMKLVPGHLRLLMEGSRPAAALPRACLVLGGEAADWELADRARRMAPGLRIVNHYGPTETTVGVAAGEMEAEGAPARAPAPPLGRPLAGARVYVLDHRLEPLPAGVPGELCAAGAGVARGYLRRPSATAERFVPDPFSGEAGARMYRTGDRARHLADGRLEFLGRIDRQVKVRGFRVEPGEVQAALNTHPHVGTSRVVPRDDGEGGVRLVAYVIPAPGEFPDPAELRAHLAARLPEPLVPSAFVPLSRLPLTPNGKLDTAALPAPEDAARAAALTAPRTPAEARLAGIWKELLKRDAVGVADDFFDLGGNSFLAVRLMARIAKEFDRRLPLAALIAAGTVEKMAALLPAEGSGGAEGHRVEIRATGRLTPLFCVHPGHGGVVCYLDLARHLSPQRPVYGLQSLDMEREGPVTASISEMALRYADAVEEGRPDGPLALAGWSFGGLVAYELARVLRGRGREVEHLFLFDCRLPVTSATLSAIDEGRMRASLLYDHSIRAAGYAAMPGIDELAGLTLDAQLQLIEERTGLAAEKHLPADVDRAHLERYLEVRLGHVRALRGYVPGPYDGALTLFRARETNAPHALAEMRAAVEEAARSPDYGWSGVASGPLQVREAAGTHDTMLAEPHVRGLARQTDALLAARARP